MNRFAGRIRQFLTDPVALGYLALVAALVVWALTVTGLDDSGESMAGVVPVLATAPFGFVLVLLPDHAASFLVAVAIGGLVNALVIGWCSQTLRKRRSS
ncbi:hypothetical protein MTQ01_01895 [Streptomyces sp. XM4193]|uniref:SCO4225 family membrane protein n=1 Tax=Streptomyces sp. XM4193 TaxID=2929782 RepID=UPI001FF84B45|nr:hypothetical protein [Streptomyces sp. XM4193]MCK1794796.1 hypothetical protein [Streptomyces sp. XM4193]